MVTMRDIMQKYLKWKKWRSERKPTATFSMHAHGKGGNRASRTYVVKGLRP